MTAATGSTVPCRNAAKPKSIAASCRGQGAGRADHPAAAADPKQARTTPEDNGRGQSADKTLGWDWKVDKDGSRKFRVYQWNGQRYAQVLDNDVPAPPAR